ncbi:MAG: 3-deoxy-D-manno-octulosonic acid transferase [Acidobacteria bacterium]|nr:MAG: 3-deoxy-D-manno-octulosonic acid transferase [Acidobacteriota bacterium]
MYALYTLGLVLTAVALSPYFIYQAVRHKKYLSTWRERLGHIGHLESSGAATVWVHAVSVGETLAVYPLLRVLHDRAPEVKIVVSTVTETGQAVARRRFGEWARVIYFPFDFGFSVRRCLEAINPSLVLVVETEIWPTFLRLCRRRGIPVILVNGRISNRSFAGYRTVRSFMERVLDHFTLLLMQSARDAERILALGADPGRVMVTGNLKYDLEIPNVDQKISELNDVFDLTGSPLIVAGSTASGEEKWVLEAFAILSQKSGMENVRLLLAPRHPERFGEVAALIERMGFDFVRRSEAKGERVERSSRVILLDTLGELAAVYATADVVFVGGSLVPVGGHNILEPALFGKPIVIGPYTSNFQAIVDEFKAEHALIQLSPPSPGSYEQRLADIFEQLFTDARRREELGRRARHLLDRNRGATERTLAEIGRFLGAIDRASSNGGVH